jgi:hypothetical protein
MSIGSRMPPHTSVMSSTPCQIAANSWPTSVGAFPLLKFRPLAIQKRGCSFTPAARKIGVTSPKMTLALWLCA